MQGVYNFRTLPCLKFDSQIFPQKTAHLVCLQKKYKSDHHIKNIFHFAVSLDKKLLRQYG